MTQIDLNADMGESFGDWTKGDDAALLGVVSSANIACGFHGGDPDVMAKTMGLAVERGVGIGAHPGFADLQGFGRRRMMLSAENLRNLVTYQLGAAQAMAQMAGGKVQHLKLHGALGNMASEDGELAETCFKAALDIDPDLIIIALAATVMQEVVEKLGCRWAGEIFADRAYNDDATLVARGQPGAVIHDPEVAATRISEMVKQQAIITTSGKRIAARIDTICVHGDTANAIQIAGAVKSALIADGTTICRLSEKGLEL